MSPRYNCENGKWKIFSKYYGLRVITCDEVINSYEEKIKY